MSILSQRPLCAPCSLCVFSAVRVLVLLSLGRIGDEPAQQTDSAAFAKQETSVAYWHSSVQLLL
eukprot:scaffold2065_cov128-Ochromonas_danica.AAC.2